MYTNIRSAFSCLCIACMLALVLTPSGVGAATNTWQGDDLTNPTYWDDADNWSDGVPTSDDDIVFDATAAAKCSANVAFKVNSIASAAAMDQAFDDGAQACTTVAGVSWDNNGQVIRLRGKWVMTGDGNMAWETGPTYTIDTALYDVDLQGTGNLANNSGANTFKVHKISGANTSKTTTHNGANTLNCTQWTRGAGTWTNSRLFYARCTGANDLSFDASGEIDGAEQWFLFIIGAATLNIPQINASGMTKSPAILSNTASASGISLQGPVTCGRAFSIYKNGTGYTRVATNDNALNIVGPLYLGNANASGTAAIDLGASVLNIDTLSFGSHNAGVCSVFCKTSVINDTGNFTLGTNTIFNSGTGTLNLVGSGSDVVTMATELAYDVITAKTSPAGKVTLADNLTCTGDFTGPSGVFDHNGQTLTAGGDVLMDLDTLKGATAGSKDSLYGGSGQFHVGSTTAVSAANLTLVMGTQNGIVDDDRGYSALTLSISPACTVTNSGTAAATTYNGLTATPFIMGNNSKFVTNATMNSFIVNGAGIALTNIGTGCFIGGSGAIGLRASGTGTLPAFLYGGTGTVAIRNLGTAEGEIGLTGNLSALSGTIDITRASATNGFTLRQNGFSIAAGNFNWGCAIAGGTFNFHKRGTITGSGAINGTAYNLGTTNLFDSATTTCASYTHQTTHNYVAAPGQSLTLTGNPGTLTSEGKYAPSKLVIASAGTVTAADAVKADTVIISAGILQQTAGRDSFDLYFGMSGGEWKLAGDTVILKNANGTGGTLTPDAASLWKILDGGRITGFNNDTMPKTQFLGGGTF